jgi:hypothetical protein
MLTLYAVERWLARLANSEYVGDFVLKGGMLLAAFGQRRPTVDVDTLARNMVAEQEAVAARVAEVAELPDAEDGIEFLTDTVAARTIRSLPQHFGEVVTAAIGFADPLTEPHAGFISWTAGTRQWTSR